MEAAKIKYVVVPGEVTSKKDGQRHFVRAGQLMQLYGVNPKECVVISEDEYYRRGDMDGMTVLRPRYDGHYRHVSRPRCRC